MNILISSAGSQNGANIIKALRTKDFKLVGCDCDPMSAGLYLADKRYLVPKNKELNFIPEILKIVEKEKIDVVLPTYSTEFPVFAWNADKFKGKIVLSDYDTYQTADNKPIWMKILKDKGIPVPEIDPVNYPKILKPIVGSGSKHQYIVNDYKEYFKYKNEANFCSEYIEGQEYVIDGMSDLEGKMICAMPRIRLVAVGGGAKKCVTLKNNKLVKIVKDIVETLGLVGAFNVQCIEKGGKFYFIDINNRYPSGGMPLAVASGINMPLMAIKLLLGEKIKPKLRYNLIMLRYDEEVIIDQETLKATHSID